MHFVNQELHNEFSCEIIKVYLYVAQTFSTRAVSYSYRI
jgi:hypothetical protein